MDRCSPGEIRCCLLSLYRCLRRWRSPFSNRSSTSLTRAIWNPVHQKSRKFPIEFNRYFSDLLQQIVGGLDRFIGRLFAPDDLYGWDELGWIEPVGCHQSLFIFDSRADVFQGQGRGIACQDRLWSAKRLDSLEDILLERQILGQRPP